MNKVNKKNIDNKKKLNDIKTILILVGIILFSFSLLKMKKTYSLFESELSANSKLDIAKWVIEVNNENVTNGYETQFTMDRFNISENENTLQGNFAPGIQGYTDIVIRPKNVQTSLRYDIKIDKTELKESGIDLNLNPELEDGTVLIKTGADQYTRVITLKQMEQNKDLQDRIRINIVWPNDDTKHVRDTEIGMKANDKIKIPVEIKFTQYLGEKIEEIQGN